MLLPLLGGLKATAFMAERGLAVMPLSIGLGALAWALYILPPLWLFRRLGVFRDHPLSGFVLAFAWGGLGAVYLALPANQAVFGLCAKLVGPAFCQRWGTAIAGPSNEEPLKLIGVILLILIAPVRFRTISSVMALGALTGLGFQVVEDFFYTVNGALNHPDASQVEPVIQILLVRGVFCGLWSHAAYTAVASFGVGYFIAHPEVTLGRRLAVAIAAFFTAWFLHGFWNSPILGELMQGPLLLLYFPLKGLPIVLAAFLLWRVARREARG
jgi:RsiW-degrading membrane proteinase PrsW (M82 family)